MRVMEEGWPGLSKNVISWMNRTPFSPSLCSVVKYVHVT